MTSSYWWKLRNLLINTPRRESGIRSLKEKKGALRWTGHPLSTASIPKEWWLVYTKLLSCWNSTFPNYASHQRFSWKELITQGHDPLPMIRVIHRVSLVFTREKTVRLGNAITWSFTHWSKRAMSFFGLQGKRGRPGKFLGSLLWCVGFFEPNDLDPSPFLRGTTMGLFTDMGLDIGPQTEADCWTRSLGSIHWLVGMVSRFHQFRERGEGQILQEYPIFL